MTLKARVEGKGQEVGIVPSLLPAASGRCATSRGPLIVVGGSLFTICQVGTHNGCSWGGQMGS